MSSFYSQDNDNMNQLEHGYERGQIQSPFSDVHSFVSDNLVPDISNKDKQFSFYIG